VNRRHFALRSGSALAALALTAATLRSAQAASAVTRMSGQQAYALAATGQGFSIGPVMAASTVYVFFDTACPHCAHLWESARPLLGKLKMVWMPVGILGPKSVNQGATILASANPAAAMSDNETRLLARQGGITPSATLGEDVMGKVKANTGLLEKLGVDSVPLLVYRNARSGEYGSQTGAANTQQLAELLGL